MEDDGSESAIYDPGIAESLFWISNVEVTSPHFYLCPTKVLI